MVHLYNNIQSAPINNAIDFILNQKYIDISDKDESTMLHHSCGRKDGLPLVELLLYLGIDKDRKNLYNYAALNCA